MIPQDDSLSEDMLAYEFARKRRRMFELVMTCSVCLTATLLSKWGTTSPVPVYAYLATLGIFGHGIHAGMRDFGMARHIGVAGELAKSLPFCLVIVYILVWLAASQMLIGTNALSAPFGAGNAGGITLVLLSAACWYTMYGPLAQRIDMACNFAWFAVLFPTLHTSDTLSSSTVMVLFRIVCMLSSVWCLNVREEGRHSPARWNAMTHYSAQKIVAISATMAVFRLTQTAWLIHCFPPFVMAFMLLIIGLNEKRDAAYMRAPDYDQDGDEFPHAVRL